MKYPLIHSRLFFIDCICISIFCLTVIYSCNSKTETKKFIQLGATQTSITFKNIPASNAQLNILYYIDYYNGGGVATGDINNDGLTDIYFTANSRGGNKLYLNKGNLKFEDITVKAGVAGIADWSSGVTMADVNGDGWLDIYVCAVSKKHGLTGRNALYINNHDNTFTEEAVQYGLDFSGYSEQAAFFDYDHDGDLDCYLLNQSDHPHQYIVDTIWRRKFDENAGDRFYRNNTISPSSGGNRGEAVFTDISKSAGIYQSSLGFGLGLAVADLNNDGWDDIYIGNDFHENDYYYLNNGDGSFSESSAKYFNHYSRFSMGNDIADYNNDGQPDIVTVDMLPPDEKTLKTYGSDERVDIYNYKLINNGYQPQFARNCLQRNNGNGKSFSDVGLIAGISATDWSWCPLFADFDNDGNKDLFIANGIVKRTADLDYVRFVTDLNNQKNFNNSGNFDEQALQKMPDGSAYCFMFKGNSRGSFVDKSSDWGIAETKGYYTGAAYADLDNDGDLDIVVNPINATASIYQNNTSHKNYIDIKFHGDSVNSFGIGAKAWLFHHDSMQYQQLMLTRGFQSSSYERLHFGLDSINKIDSILIVWPDQSYQLIKNSSLDTIFIVDKRNASGKFVYDNFFQQKKNVIVQVPSLLEKPWQHKEDMFDDFTVQYLMPHQLSKQGPKIAVADVNNDGLDDFYVCGAVGQSGKLFIQNSNGKFTDSDTSAFVHETNCEDVDAVFFDADNDGDKDLYAASGGNYYTGNDWHLLDRLYLNDGKGNFTKAENNLPKIFSNKDCVSAGDIDGDGDMDIFVGTLADPKTYGLPQTSYLLLNDGKGNFSIAGKNIINLDNIGMVTSSIIADINNDGKTDLLIAGEWMPLTIFINEGKTFSSHVVSNSTGLWQCMQATDINGDGYTDILAGNWGLNSKLAAGKTSPLKLYVKDFDNSGKKESLLAYNINGTEYSFLPKDEIEQVLPIVKKKFLYYKDFAGKPVQQAFDNFPKDILQLQAEDLSSVVFINDGKGEFTMQALPYDLQITPLSSFTNIPGTNMFLAGGNFFGVLPYEGRYDAASLMSFSFKENTVDVLDIKGQIRDMKWLHTKSGDILVAAKNNEPLSFYKINIMNQ